MTNPQATLASKLTDLWFVTPQVMAHRLTRMAIAGNNPTAADRAEMKLMSDEKVQAFSQSWLAMWMDLCLMPLRMAPAFMASLTGSRRSQAALRNQVVRASTSMLAAGVAPVHRTAVANSKRLKKRKA